MPQAKFIVFERTSDWSLVLRPRLAKLGVRLREVRSLAECQLCLADFPASMLAMELTTNNVMSIINGTTGLTQKAPLARVVILARYNCAHLEWMLREAGVIEFVLSPRRLEAIVEVAKRHFRSLPTNEESIIKQLGIRLPWS